MRNLTEIEKKILAEHAEWVRSAGANGVRADLRRANLSGADLRYADLRRANLSRADLRYADLRRANLSRADLRCADLSRANLRYADLRYADLRRANLSGADLRCADLRCADLSRANLSRANLRCADLSRADLSGADLSGAYLTGAYLIGADLTGAYLSRADLRAIRADYESILSAAAAEAPALIAALREGRVNGSAYRQGGCGCLVGTLEIARGGPENCVVGRDSARPAERWFLAIRRGDTPENNQVAALSLEWAEAFSAKIAKGAPCSEI